MINEVANPMERLIIYLDVSELLALFQFRRKLLIHYHHPDPIKTSGSITPYWTMCEALVIHVVL